MTTKESVTRELDELSNAELLMVRRYVGFLRKRSHRPKIEKRKLRRFYAEFAAEDKALAEQGMSEYARKLRREDAERGIRVAMSGWLI
jgi:hypothetical protein